MPTKTERLPSVTKPKPKFSKNGKPRDSKQKSSDDKVKAMATPIPNYQTANTKLDLAEQRCTQIALGDTVTERDLVFFDDLGWDSKTIEKQIRRAANIAHLQSVAGSKSGLAKKQAELDETRERNAAKLEEIDAEIKRLMDGRDAYLIADRELEADIRNQANAQARLRTLVPNHIKRLRDLVIGGLKKSDLNKERLALRSKISSLQGLPRKHSSTDHNCIVAFLKGLPNDEFPAGILDDRNRVNVDAYQKFAAERIEKLPAMVSKLEALETEYEKQIAEIDQRLDFYLA